MTDFYFRDVAESSNDYVYVDSSTRRVTQWPLAISWPTGSGATDPNVLLNDNDAEYFTYSGGINTTAVLINRLERIGSISLNVLSGSGIKVGVLVGEALNDPEPNFYGAPYTVSGTATRTELYFPTSYAQLPESHTELMVPLAGSGQFNIVLPKPVVNKSFTIIHSGIGSYTISQILPRRATGAFDLEVNAIKAYHVSADLIEAISLQVSDSIVVSPDIPNKSITGDKILDGTVSGVIITPGTITSNEIAAGTITGNKIAANTISGALITAGTITADKLQVGNLEALSANTGSLNVTNTVTVTSGQINAGLVQITQSGISIGNVSTELTETNALRIYGKINPSGGNVVGLALYNNLNPNTPHAIFQTDFDNAVEIENLAPDGVTNINIPQGGYVDAFNVWIADPDEPQFSVGYDYTDVRNELYLSNNLTMAAPSGIATLKETVVEGNLEIIGDVLTSSTGITSSDVTIDVPTTINSNLTLNGNLTGNFFINSTLTDSAPCLYFRRDVNTTLPAVNSYIDINFTTFIKNSAFTYNSSTAVFTFLYSGWYMFSIFLFTNANQQTYFRTDTNWTFSNYYHTAQNVWGHTLGPLWFNSGYQLKFRGGANASVITPQVSLYIVRVA